MSKKVLSKAKFYSKANYAINNGFPVETLYDMQDDYDITTEEIDAWVKTKTKKTAKGTAISRGKEELEKIYNTLDTIIIQARPNLVTFRRGENVEFYEYRGGVYVSVREQEIIDLIDNKMTEMGLLEHRTAQRRIKDTMARIISAMAYMPGRRFDDELKQKWYLNLKNGLLDVTTFTLLPHTPEYFSTTQIPFDYNPEADCPRFKTFIDQVAVNDPKNAAMIQEMYGYCLMDGNPRHKVFYLYGLTARNGKSTVAKVICGLIGRGNTSMLSLSQIASDNSSILGAMVGKQLNFSDEVSSKYVESPALTMMSSEGIIEVNPKYKKSFMYQVHSKFIIACNDIPRFKESQGMKHRTIIIPFMYQIPEAKRIFRLDEILLEEEGSGILNWAIQGAQLLNTNNQFTISKESAEDSYDSELESNPVLAYLEHTYDFSKEFENLTMVEEMYGNDKEGGAPATGFRDYCHKKGIGLMSYQKFSKELKRFMRETGKIESRRELTDDNIAGRRGYVGLLRKADNIKSPYYVEDTF